MKFLSSFEKNIKFTPPLIALSYALISALWIVVTDYFLASYITDPIILTQYQTIKGWFFIVSTALLLYYLIRSSFRKIEETTTALLNSESKYRILLDQASDGIVLADEFGNILDANNEACNILGYERSELLKMNLKDMVDKDDLERNPFRYKELYSGETVHTERLFLRKDGQTVHVEITSRMLYQNNIQAIFRDITRRKKAEEELRNSEQQYRLLFRKNPHPMWVYDLETLSFLAVNNAAVESYGYSHEDFLKMTLKDIRPAEDVPELIEQVQNVLDDYQRSGPWRHMKKDGTIIYVEIISSSISFSGRNARIALAVDITESRNAMQALLESERRYRSLFEQTPISIWEEDFSIIKNHIDIIKLTGVENFAEYLEKYPEEIVSSIQMVKVLDVNQATLELFEATDKEEVISGLSRIAEEGTYQAQKESIVAISEGKTRFEIETVSRTLKGRKLHISYRWAVAEGYEKTYAKVMVSIADISERKRAEEAIKAVNQNLSNIISASALPIFALDSQGKVNYCWNRAAEDLFGWKSEEVLGRFIPTIPSHKTDEFYSLLERVTRGEICTGYEVQRLRRDGSLIDVSLSAAPLRDENGSITGSINIVSDITERRRAERELMESETKFRELANSIADIFLAMNRELIVTYWNKTSGYVTGISQEEAVGKQIYELFPQIRGSKLEEEFFAALELQQVRSIVRNLQLNGQSRIYEISVYPFMSGLSVFGKDITDRQIIEQELDISNERFSSFMQNLPGIAFIKDLSGRYLYANKTWEVLSGRKIETPGSICDSDIWDEEISSEFSRNDRQVISSGQGIYITEVCPQPDGLHHWLMSKFPIKDSQGSYSAIGAIGIDITDKIKAEEEIKKLNYELSEKFGRSTSQLDDARRELQAFAFAVSHDLRTPLRAIDGFSQILLEEHSSKMEIEAKRYLNIISRNTGQMEQLIDDLTTFSKLQLNEPVLKKINMNDLVESVIQTTLRSEDEDRINFTVDILPECCGDKQMIQQVWKNLISNAVKFSGQKEKTTIAISGYEENKETVYSISDNGIGFNDEYAGRLFEIFYKLHQGSQYEGTGVGLAIVKRIISRHGGRVWAKGIPHKGASFYFTLPMVKK